MSETAAEVAPETGDEQVEQMLAEAVAQPESEETQDQQGEEADAKPDTGGKADSILQAEISKWKSLARKHEQNAKANADAAKKYAEYEDSQKTELQRLVERAEAAERERDEERRGRARLMAAATHNLSADLLDRLGGSTEEEITETAQVLSQEIESEVARRLPALVETEVEKRLAELSANEPHVPARQRPIEALTPGAMPANSQPEDGNDFLRRMAGRT